MIKLIIFFDGYCPLCIREIKLLKLYNTKKHIQFEDINGANFAERFNHVDFHRARAILHGQLPNGNIITGMDVTFLAWRLVNRHKWLRLLELPILRTFTDWTYLIFAKHRRSITKAFCKKLTD